MALSKETSLSFTFLWCFYIFGLAEGLGAVRPIFLSSFCKFCIGGVCLTLTWESCYLLYLCLSGNWGRESPTLTSYYTHSNNLRLCGRWKEGKHHLQSQHPKVPINIWNQQNDISFRHSSSSISFLPSFIFKKWDRTRHIILCRLFHLIYANTLSL